MSFAGPINDLLSAFGRNLDDPTELLELYEGIRMLLTASSPLSLSDFSEGRSPLGKQLT